MLKYIKVIPLAAESLGARSMCTYVETSDIQILFDAGVSLCPSRFGLPPHPEEFDAIRECRERIADAAERASIVTLSHYHFDHHTPSYEDWLSQWTEGSQTAEQIYRDKTVLAKNARERINYSQRRRGWMFQKTGGACARKLETADGKVFSFGKTTVRFSKPVAHGPEDSLLGYVLITIVECDGEKFMFAPDVQGPISACTLELIIDEKPDLIMLGGPPLYLAGFKVSEEQIQAGLRNLQKVVEHVPAIILEHHILRDENWKDRAMSVFYGAYKTDHTVLTAAEFLGRPNSLLEAKRRKLYEETPPSKEFEKWMNIGSETRKHVKPPA